jgi:hypothetical protein
MNSLQADGHSPVGFPHSEISGSRPVSGSPELIAAVHVLRRLWLPRHPPYALRSLTLSLRHASSRVRDSTRESGIRYAPFSSCAQLLRLRSALPRPSRGWRVALLPWTITIYSRRQELTSLSLFSFQRTCGRRTGRPVATEVGREETFVELIGIEPMTSGLQSQRSPN